MNASVARGSRPQTIRKTAIRIKGIAISGYARPTTVNAVTKNASPKVMRAFATL